MRVIPLSCAVLLFLASMGGPARAATLQVGPGKPHSAPCKAIAVAADGDTIEVDAAGSYDGDVCRWTQNGLTIRGVNGRAKIDAAGKSSGGKAIWVIGGNDTVIENIELSGCTVPDKNGAGIRQEGRNLTVRSCYFHDNENGILTGAVAGSRILVEYSEFARNGDGAGYAHNLYIGNIAEFTLRHCYSHHARSGHLVKSRAAVNYILYNRLSDEADGRASYELDLPNGGTSYVIGNVIHQGQATENSGLMTFQVEGAGAGNPGTDLYVVNNTFVNERTPGGVFIKLGAGVTTPAIIRNNIFSGPGTITSQANAVVESNYSGTGALFVAPASYDYSLQSGSPAVDQGRDPGVAANGFALSPAFQYLHPAGAEPRGVQGEAIDLGAFEFANPGLPPDAGSAGPDASVPGLDAGSAPSDAGAATDASTLVDGGLDPAGDPAGDPGMEAGGCGCTSAGAESAVGLLGLLGLGVGRRRRS